MQALINTATTEQQGFFVQWLTEVSAWTSEMSGKMASQKTNIMSCKYMQILYLVISHSHSNAFFLLTVGFEHSSRLYRFLFNKRFTKKKNVHRQEPGFAHKKGRQTCNRLEDISPPTWRNDSKLQNYPPAWQDEWMDNQWSLPWTGFGKLTIK